MGVSLDGRRNIAQRRASRVAIMFVIALLHGLAYWATSSTLNVPRVPRAPVSEWVFISSARTAEFIRSDIGDAHVRSATTALAPTPLTTPLPASDDSPPDQTPGLPPIDWNSELERVAKGTAGADASAQRRDFGFPQRAPSIKTPVFDWDRVHTHRVEIASEGGVIIHLSDKCVMVFMPLPFALCGVGKKVANGHLLDHMNDVPVAATPAP